MQTLGNATSHSNHIEPGGIIFSDQRDAYNEIRNNNTILLYQHLTINYAQPKAWWIPTLDVQQIMLNARGKIPKFKAMNGVHKTMFTGHLDE